MEEPLKAFTRKISGCSQLNYWERLAKLKLSSIQRRFERYKIFYIWKALNGLVPNFGINVANTSDLRGWIIAIPIFHGNSSKIVSLKEKSLAVEGSKLFNDMPRYIRNMTGSKDRFKIVLDKFLALIPDQPAGTRDLVPCALDQFCQPTNSLKHWTKTLCLLSWTPPSSLKEKDPGSCSDLTLTLDPWDQPA